MADDWQDQAADNMLQARGMPPDDEEDTDLPMRPPAPPPIDPRARQMMDEYFQQQQLRSGSEAAAMPHGSLFPPEQRRSPNVSVQSPELSIETPRNLPQTAPMEVAKDIRDTPHTEEYIKDALDSLLEGFHGVGDFADAPSANASNPMARQLGMRELNKMTNSNTALEWLFHQLAVKYGYSQAIRQINDTLQYGFDHERYRDRISQTPLSRPPVFEGMAQ